MSMLAIDLISGIYRRLPIVSGLTPLAFNPAMNLLFKSAPSNAFATLHDGAPINVAMNDYHGRILYLFGTNDPKVQQTAVALLRPGDVFLDIGANYSTIGLSASHVVGPTGAVHLFEPQRRISNSVELAIKAGHYTNVTLHRVGLLDRDATLSLRSPDHHSGRATFAQHGTTPTFDHQEVCEVRAVDTYVDPLVRGRPFGAKLDIEGSEPKIMPWLLSQRNLVFLIFEAAHNQRQLYDEVRDLGFYLLGLKRHPLKMRLVRVDDFSEMKAFHDLVAVRPAAALQKELHPRLLKLVR
ncbi:FkbM family methyltransferase [Bradyrhizobium sp. USDA 4474]